MTGAILRRPDPAAAKPGVRPLVCLFPTGAGVARTAPGWIRADRGRNP